VAAARGVSELSSAQRDFLRAFFAQPFAGEFYLTGGTALSAFHLGHRVSLDLDLFVPTADAVRDAARFTIGLRDEGGLAIASHFAQGGFHNFRLVYLGERLRVDFCHDAAPQLPKEDRGGIRVDGLLDILANKVVALLDFPEPKHFVDLYAGLRSGRVEADGVMQHAARKRTIDPYHLARALHQGKHVRLAGLDLCHPIDPGDLSAFFEELRNGVLDRLRPPGA